MLTGNSRQGVQNLSGPYLDLQRNRKSSPLPLLLLAGCCFIPVMEQGHTLKASGAVPEAKPALHLKAGLS